MRVLYIGANLRMRQSNLAAPAIRGLGLKLGLEQSGVQVFTIMAGDQVNIKQARTVYKKGLKRFLPHQLTRALRDIFEIYFDWKLFRITKNEILKIKPDIILQKHSRYGKIGVRLGHKFNIPVFLDDITPVWEGEVTSDRSLKLIARKIRKKVFSQAAGLIAVSPTMEEQLRSEGILDNRIVLVPNGVDCDLFDPEVTTDDIRLKYGLTNKIVVGYVGNFAKIHKLDYLVRTASTVAQSVPNIHFLLVGEYLDEKLIELARDYGVTDRFTVTGRISHEQVPSYLKAMDFCVLPSTLSYMSPMKIYEYMAMQKPVIAPFGNSSIEAVIVPNKNGLLFEAENEDSFINAIIQLATDLEKVQELGTEARRFVQSKYTWYYQTQSLLRAFKAALGV